VASLLNLVFLILQVTLLFLFSYQIKKKKRNAKLLVYAMIFGIIATTLALLQTEIEHSLLRRSLLSIELFFYGFEYILIYFHFRGTISDKISLLQISLISFVYGIHAGFGIYYAVLSTHSIPELLWDVSYNILGVLCFGFVSYSLIMVYRRTLEVSALVQTLAGILLCIGFLGSIFETPMIRDTIVFAIPPDVTGILKAIGILIIVIIFIINPDYIERLPVQTYGIMAFDKNGSTVSYYAVETKGKFEDVSIAAQANLATALTSAILTFVKEVMGSRTNLDRIETSDRLIILDIGETIGVAVIAERGTKILLESMKRCQKELNLQVGKEVMRGDVDVKKVKSIFTNAFPYIVFT
jgi:hypothetical protein